MKQMLMRVNWLHVYHVAGFVGLFAMLVYMFYLFIKLDLGEAKEGGHACEQYYRDHNPEFLGSVQSDIDDSPELVQCSDPERIKHMNFCECCGCLFYGDGFYCHLCFDKFTRK